MKLSVIIPVYRTASTLDRCVRSVISQSYRDLQVILVDDGSPDECPRICDEWARRDSRIEVIHQRNGGLSAARNAGLDHARGDFLTFVDSDDYLAPDTLQAVMALTADCDLLEYPVWQHFGSPSARMLRPKDKVYATTDDYWLGCQAYLHTYAANKVYRRWLFDTVRFPERRVFEDAYTLPRLLLLQPRIRTTSRGLYYYCDNPHGITATANGAALSQLLDAHLTNAMPQDDLYYLHLLNIQMDVCELTGAPPRLEERHVKPVGNLKLKIKAISLNLLGIKRICKINKAIHQLRNRW